jgi:hypothetical protein
VKNYTDHFKERTGSTSGEEPSYLLEITHAQLAQPIRVTNDNDDIVSNGDTYIACAFRIQFPDDIANTMPRVPIAVDNVGREMTQWLEGSDGGRGATVRIMQVMRDTPDVVEQEYMLDLLNVKQNMLEVSGQLGYENVLDLPALAATYTPETAPGIF